MASRRRLLVQPGARRRTADADLSRLDDGSESDADQNETDDLPPYEALQLPLSDKAIRTLTELTSNQALMRSYESHLMKSAELLREGVGAINELYSERKIEQQHLVERRQERQRQKQRQRQENGGDNDEPVEPTKAERQIRRTMENLAAEVPPITKELERSARQTIDLRAGIADERAALGWTVEQVAARRNEIRLRERQREVRQAQREVRRAAAAAGQGGGPVKAEDGDREDEQDADDADDAAPPPSAMGLLEQARTRRRAEYERMAAHEKYGLDNDYIAFRQVLHEASFPEGDVVLPDASTWFDAAGAPVLYGPDEAAAQADEDDDLIVAREVISFKCPLSLVTMTEPYQSRVCHHTFQRQSILEYLRNGPAKCPQTGCDKSIASADLIPDMAMCRRIARAEQRAQRRGEAATSDVEAEEVGDDDLDSDGGRGPAHRSKAESRARSVKREQFTQP